jgi:hypothetical protein
MDKITKFLNKIAYKFPKGYPDINDSQDLLLLEGFLNDLGVDIILENQGLVSVLQSNLKDYGTITASGRDTLRLEFSDVPSRGKGSDNVRRDIYDDIKALTDKESSLSNYKRLSTGGSSIGSATVDFNGKTYKLIVKGAGDNTAGDTDVKEALVSLFYMVDIDTPFDKENLESRVSSLRDLINENGIDGEENKAVGKVDKYLEAISKQVKASNINFINQPLSSALAIKEVYPGQRLIRSGTFDSVRKLAQRLTGLPADKWNPGDLYVQIGDVDLEGIDNIELVNDLFADDWGDDSKPLVSVSLKQADAQGGKAKALLNKYTKVKTDYNLTTDEISFDENKYLQGIKRLRMQISRLVDTNDNIVYNIENAPFKKEGEHIRFLRGKYAALKSIEFLFRQFPNDKVDDAIIALVGFALSLSGVNPSFFKVTGQKSGSPGEVDGFKRGQNIILYNIDGDYDPIKIEDTASFGGLKMNFKIEKGGEPYSVAINARNNGNTQGTLEVQKIKPL